jgi:Ca-activated chloride channel family protein
VWHRLLVPLAFLALWLVLVLGLAFPVRSQPAGPVSACLVLVVDASGSIDGDEWKTQTEGTATALVHPTIVGAVRDSPHGAVALALVYFSGSNEAKTVVPWQRVTSREDLTSFAALVLVAPRDFSSFTSLTHALRHARDELLACPWPAEKLVLDLSFDGVNNSGDPDLEGVRNEVASAGVTINALAITKDEPGLREYAEERVIVGPGAFALSANDFDTYRDALRRKLVLELF